MKLFRFFNKKEPLDSKKAERDILRYFNRYTTENNKVKALFDKSAIPIVILDKDRFILDCNDSFIGLVDYNEKELMNGFDIIKILSSLSTKKEFKKFHKGCLESSIRIKHTTVIKDKYNNKRSVELVMNKIAKKQEVILTILDISDKDKLKRDIDNNNSFFKDLFTKSKFFMWKKDILGRYIYCTNSFARMFFGIDNEGALTTKNVLYRYTYELIQSFIKDHRTNHTFIFDESPIDQLTIESKKVCKYLQIGIIDHRLVILEIVQIIEYNRNRVPIGVISFASDKTLEKNFVLDELYHLLKAGKAKPLVESEYFKSYSLDMGKNNYRNTKRKNLKEHGIHI